MDVSLITESIYVGKQAKGSDYDILRKLEIDLIINMAANLPPTPDAGSPNIRTLWYHTYDLGGRYRSKF
jgi:hypothetical protein